MVVGIITSTFCVCIFLVVQASIDNMATQKLTNRQAIEIYDKTRRSKCKNIDLYKDLASVCPEVTKFKVNNVADKLCRLKKLKADMSRNRKKDEIQGLLDDEFNIADLPTKSSFQNDGVESCSYGKKEKTLKRKEDKKQKNILTELSENELLAKRLKITEDDNIELTKRLKALSPRKIKQKVRRKDDSICRIKLKMKNFQNLASSLTKQKERVTAKYRKLQKKEGKLKSKGTQCILKKEGNHDIRVVIKVK